MAEVWELFSREGRLDGKGSTSHREKRHPEVSRPPGLAIIGKLN